MGIIFPPFHFPLLSSTPFLLRRNLLLQAIGLNYKCHSVHVCVVRVHPSSCIWGYGMFAMCQFADTEKEITLRCLMVFLVLFWTLSIWHVLLNHSLTWKKKLKILRTNVFWFCSLKEYSPMSSILYVYSTSTWHIEHTCIVHMHKVVYTHLRGLTHNESCVLRISCDSSSVVYAKWLF